MFEGAQNERLGNSSVEWDQRPFAARHAANNLPGMFRASEEEDRPVSERDVHGGRCGLALLALPVQRGRI